MPSETFPVPNDPVPSSNEPVQESQIVLEAPPVLAATNPAGVRVSSEHSASAAPTLTLQRLHPSSCLFEVVSQVRKNLIPAAFALFFAAKDGGIWFGIAIAATIITLIFSLIRYFTLRFRILDDDLIVDEGIIFRRHRTVPVHRIQNIDMVQNPLHRMVGVAEVRVETAGGSKPEATLRVLGLQQIDMLRHAVFGRRQSSQSIQTSSNELPSSQNEEASKVADNSRSTGASQVIAEIPTSRLITAGLLSDKGMFVIPIILGFFTQVDWRGRVHVDTKSIWKYVPAQLDPRNMEPMTLLIYGVGLFLLAIVFLKFFSAVWYVVRFHGFRLERLGDDIRIRCGLFTKVSATVPRRRIQFISIHRQWLGRYLGLVSMRVETAGGGAESEDASTTVGRRWFMPALLESDVPKLLKEIRPDLDWQEDKLDWKPLSPLAARRMVRLSLLVCLVAAVLGGIFWWPWGPAVGLVLLPITIWLSRRKARATRYARTDSFVAFRSGMVTRKWSFTFFDKIQAVQYSQSPFDRRWNMASLTIDTAGAGPAEHKIAIEYLDADFAQSEHDFLTARASQSSWALT